FKLKHIFHHNVGNSNFVHKRLDITDDFIEKNKLNDVHTFNHLIHQRSKNIDLNNKKFFHSDNNDWPELYKKFSPWTIQLPISSIDNYKTKKFGRNDNDVMDYLNAIHNNNNNNNYNNIFDNEDMFIQDKLKLNWDNINMKVPNVSDTLTILTLALMSGNAYVETPHKSADWYNISDPRWDDRNTSRHNHQGFGWMTEGVRGHVFVDNKNETVVIAIKGTSFAVLARRDKAMKNDAKDTVGMDKINDNLLFSCCCARVSYMWSTVCNCYKSSYNCDQKCLEKELYREDRYYRAALDIYSEASKLYPNAKTIWATGHSLGGSLAALIGRTFGLPVVAFEAPGELLATRRLHLPMPPGLPFEYEHVWHVGHTADPIYMGTCNGASSSCSVAGYAMETQCHTGKQCVYDVVTDKNWNVNIMNHRIRVVIEEVLSVYNAVPECAPAPPCRDCFNWRF
ncbi:lipase family protein, partial [Ascoidea rubescens DSM 1968]